MEMVSNQEVNWEIAAAFPWPPGSKFPNYSLDSASWEGKEQYTPKVSMVWELSKPLNKNEKWIDLLESESSCCL